MKKLGLIKIIFLLMMIIFMIIALPLYPVLLEILDQMEGLGVEEMNEYVSNLDPAVDDQISTLGSISFILIVIAIIYLIRLIKYISCLNIVKLQTSDIFLNDIFKCELLVIGSFIISLFIYVVDIVVPIIQCGAIIYLEKWIKGLETQQVTNPQSTEKFIKLIRIMEIGLIYSSIVILLNYFVTISGIMSIIFYFLGKIIYAVGYFLIGDGILKKFPPIHAAQFTNDGAAMENISNRSQNMYGSYPNPNDSIRIPREMPVNDTISQPENILKNGGGSEDHCSFCGAPKIDRNTKFCSTCGQRIA